MTAKMTKDICLWSVHSFKSNNCHSWKCCDSKTD